MSIKLTEWDEANSMVDGYGDEPCEPYCRDCTQKMIDEYFEEYADENPTVDDYMESAHHGGFVPAIIDGYTCILCEKQITEVAQ